MALTKVTKSGLADNSVDAAKLVDGTVVAACLSSCFAIEHFGDSAGAHDADWVGAS